MDSRTQSEMTPVVRIIITVNKMITRQRRQIPRTHGFGKASSIWLSDKTCLYFDETVQTVITKTDVNR